MCAVHTDRTLLVLSFYDKSMESFWIRTIDSKMAWHFTDAFNLLMLGQERLLDKMGHPVPVLLVAHLIPGGQV